MIQGPLVLERDAERHAIARAIDAATGASAVGSSVVVTGPAGIGKSQLLRQARADAAAAGMRVLGARGTDLERSFPFGVARALLERPLWRLPDDERAALLRGAAAPAAVALGIEHDPDAAVVASPSLLNAVYWVVVGLCERGPLLLCVDDLQWLDAPSLRALAFVVARCDELPLVVLGAVRDGEEPEDAQALAAIVGAGTSLQPRPLGVGAISELLTSYDVDPAHAPTLLRLSGGNPLWVAQAAEAMAQTGGHVDPLAAPGLAGLLHARLRDLRPVARDVARSVAVLGDGANLGHVAQLAATTPEDALAAADDLTTAGIFERGALLTFAHPLLAEAARTERGEHGLALAHLQAARLLRAADVPAERVAGHLLRTPATGDHDAAEVLHLAGQDATRRGAPDAAIRYLRRALEEHPGAGLARQVHRELGMAAFRTAAYDDAVALLTPTLAEPDVTIDVVGALAAALVYTAPPAEGIDVLESAALSQPDPERREWLRSTASYLTFFDPTRRTGDVPAPETVTGWADRIRLAVQCSFVEESAQSGPLAARALADGALVSDASLAFIATNPLMVLVDAERFAELDAALVALEETARVSSSADARQLVEFVRVVAELHRGDLPTAVDRGSRALRYALELGHPHNVTIDRFATAYYVDAVRLHDGTEAALAVVSQLRPPLPGDDSWAGGFRDSWILPAMANLELERGRVPRALELARTFHDEVLVNNSDAVPGWLGVVVQALVSAGQADEALAYAEATVAREEVIGLASRRAVALRYLARARPVDAVDLLRQSVALHDGGPMAVEHALSWCDLGTALRRAGARTDARTALERAADLAGACQARPLLARVREELGVLGAKPRRMAFSGVESLTASERRTADLAAGGATNREIAETLFVTAKTVESHLRAVFRKLDVSSRTELAAALG